MLAEKCLAFWGLNSREVVEGVNQTMTPTMFALISVHHVIDMKYSKWHKPTSKSRENYPNIGAASFEAIEMGRK